MLSGRFCLTAEGASVFLGILGCVGMVSHVMAFAAVESGLLTYRVASLHSVVEDIGGCSFSGEAYLESLCLAHTAAGYYFSSICLEIYLDIFVGMVEGSSVYDALA